MSWQFRLKSFRARSTSITLFGILFRVGQQGFGQCGIRLFVSASAGGAGNGVDSGLSRFNLAMRFGRGTENPETAEIKIEQVRRRIDASQRPVEGENHRLHSAG